MRTRIGQVVAFGRGGNSDGFLAYGWALPEDGFTWTDGRAAALMLPSPDAPHGFFLEFFFGVHGFPDGRGRQRVIVSVNGQEIGRTTSQGTMRLAWRAPPLAPQDRQLVIGLELPDAARPSSGRDPRLLALAMTSLRIMPLLEPRPAWQPRIAAIPPAVDSKAAAALAEQVTRLTVPEIAMAIESLGVNCEPGFFQRKCGAEPLSLLRFSGVLLHCLTQSIDDGFPGLGTPGMIDPVPEETDLKDWIIYERRHMLRYHTWVRVPDASVEDMKLREGKRLPFLCRKLLEDLENGEKLFVHMQRRTIADEEIMPLFLAIRRRGPGTLLCIGPSDEDHQPGSVEEIHPGLMRGYFSHFSLANIGRELSMPQWLAVCMNAWTLRQPGSVVETQRPHPERAGCGTLKRTDAVDLSNLPDKAARGFRKSHRVSYMVQGWITAAQLPAEGGGTACLTIGCPGDFYAVRLGFANVNPAPWRLLKVIGRASSSFGDYIHPAGTAPWVTFTQALAVDGDEVTFPPADAPSEITVAGLEEVGAEQAPSLTWTDWAPIRSLEADPASGLRVLMLRGLIPSGQTICYAAGQLRNLLGNTVENSGFDCFMGGLKFDIDRVTIPDGPEPTVTWIGNQLAGGSLFPIVQFLTKNPGQTGLLIGDSHQQGTSTTDQVTNFLYRAVVGAMQDSLGSRPLGFVNAAQGGLKSTQSFARLHAWIDAVRPSYVILPGWTYNDDDGQERADQATIERFFARLLGASEACARRGAVPIFTTPFPRDARRMGQAQLGPWRWLRKEILDMRKTGAYVLDTSQLLSAFDDGGLSGTYLPAFSTDASHPNNAGHAAIAALLRDVLA